MNELERWITSLPMEQQDLLVGQKTSDPLRESFNAKRVVHAGNPGTPVSAEEAQRIWKDIMDTVPSVPERQMAYIHIPFCQTKCLYCGFFQNTSEQEAEDRYIDYLVRELEAAAESPRFQNSLIHAVFIGGGTPTALSPDNARKLLQAIRRALPLANDCELTLEGRIHDLVPEKMDVWMENGVNRMSLGVQSFHTKIRRQMGRIDSQEEVMKNLAALKAYQQCVVIADLIYGLPDQTMDIWLEDLAMLEESGVDGMDLYQLNVFEGCDLDRRIKAGRMSPAADTRQQALMYKAAADWVGKRAFKKLSVRHWSRSPRERSLYNIYVKEGVPLIPFGSGAGGGAEGYSLMLHRALRPYEMLMDKKEKPIMGMMKQDSTQPAVNAVMHQLEQGYFEPGRAEKTDARLGELRWLFDLWCDRGLATYNGVLYRLTTAGEFWQVNMAQTVHECIKKLSGGTPKLVQDRVAAQNQGKQPNQSASSSDPPSALAGTICRLTGVDEEEAQSIISRIPVNVRSMLEAMPPAMLEMTAKSMGTDALKKMMQVAETAPKPPEEG